MVRACCVPGCNSGVNVPSHKFPKRQERCTEWIKSLNLDDLKNCSVNELQKYKVCYKHFREEDYNWTPHHRFLLNTAVPVPFAINDSFAVMDSNLQIQPTQEQQLSQQKLPSQLEELLQQELPQQLESSQQEELPQQEKVPQKKQLPQVKQSLQQQHIVDTNINLSVEQKILQPAPNKIMLTDQIARLEQQLQQHSKQLTQQKNLLMEYNTQQTKLQNQILEQQKATTNEQQPHCKLENVSGEASSTIQNHESRLQTLEEQLKTFKTTPHTSTARRKLNLQEIRKVNLTSTKKLYEKVLKLRCQNKLLLKRLTKRKINNVK